MIHNIYNKIEKKINNKIGNNYFEVFDDELTSEGWLIIVETDNEEEQKILKIVENTIEEFDGVEIEIDDIPTLYDVEYYYGFNISVEE